MKLWIEWSELMNYFESKIALRYLFAKKGHNAINIVTGISAAAVGVVTAAMICVLSVMNGFGSLVEQMFSAFDPEIRITAADGRSFSTVTEDGTMLLGRDGLLTSMDCVERVAEVVSGQALIEYKDHRLPALLMGVDDNWQQITQIDSIISDGYFSVYDGAFNRAVLGRGLSGQLGMNAHFVGGIHIYAPKRKARVNMLRPDESFHRATCFIAGEFAVNQVQYDDQLMLISLPLARQLFDYDSLEVTSLMLQLQPGVSVGRAKREISRVLGEKFVVADRYEQQADFYKILRVEKLLTTLLLVFILLIASLNIIGSLSMLIIDKREDIRILNNLGLSEQRIHRVFLLEGWLISSLGAIIGLIIGLAVCLIQQHFGLLKLGNGLEYVISAYPVRVEFLDVLVVLASVLAVGYLAAWIPTKQMMKHTTIIILLPLLLLASSCHRQQPYHPYLADTEFTTCIYHSYGSFYPGLKQQVVSLDLYSNDLSLGEDDRIYGTGTNLYLSDVFIDSLATMLPEGQYRSDTTGAEFTFFPGTDYDGNPTGVYRLVIVDDELQGIMLYPDSCMTVSYVNDSLDIRFRLYNSMGKYEAHYRGVPIKK